MGGTGIAGDISALSSQISSDGSIPGTADAGATTFSIASDSVIGSSSFAIISLSSTAVARRRGLSWDESACGTKIRRQNPSSTLVNAAASARRDQLGIILDILVLTEQPMYSKRILYQGNLSYFQLRKYLTYLLNKGFILEKSDRPKVYMITEKGRELITMLS
jgi:predicted transcriptional regulator